MRPKNILPSLLLSLLLALLLVPAGATGAEEAPLNIGYDGDVLTASSLVLELGRLAVGDHRALSLEVSLAGGHGTGDRKVAAHVYGLGLSGQWRSGDRVVSLSPGESQVLDLRLDVAAETEASLLTVLWTDGRDVPLAQLTLDLQVFKQDRLVETAESGTMVSPVGDDWSRWFYSCIGPAPVGYRLQSTDFQVKSPHNRRCGKWVKCRTAEQTAGRRCWRFSIQGHDGGTWDPDESRKGNGVVTAVYRLDRSSPVFRPL